MEDLKTTRHAVYNLQFHLIFVTKYRKHIFKKEHLDSMEEHLKAVTKVMSCEIIEFNGESDHIHMLISINPNISISSLVNVLKGVSSRKLRQKYSEIEEIYYGKHVGMWSRSYYVSSVGNITLSTLIKYIEDQGKSNSSLS